jgi:uncharacterized delta-60 repeat protein
MAYDQVSSNVVLYGGLTSGPGRDTWTWDGSTWTKRSTATKPSAFNNMGLTYDQDRGEVALFGGLRREGGLLDETWTWDGTTWTNRSPATSPPPRRNMGLAFDPAMDRMVMFGGDGYSGLLGDTWTWDGSAWRGPDAGKLDTTFSDGMVSTDFTGGDDSAGGLAILEDGKIVAAGAANAYGLNPMFAVARYEADGSLDATFGGGAVTTDLAWEKVDLANDVVLQPDGKIVAAGIVETGVGDTRFAVVRYNSDGTLDTSFSGDGVTRADFSSGTDEAFGTALLSDGRIVAAGTADATSANPKFAVAVFTPDGALDKTFGGDGKVTTDLSSGLEGASDVAVQSDDRIVVAGESGSGSNRKFALARYHTDGSLDPSFSGDGKVKIDVAEGGDFALGVTIAPDGRILAAGGTGSDGSNPMFGLIRLATDGTLDHLFNDGGRVTTDFTGGSDYASGVAIQADGRVVAVGEAASDGSNSKFAVARYNADGTPDTSFSGDGKTKNDFMPGEDGAADVAIQADGKIVAAGRAGASGMFAVARYLAA